ncbi:MAG: two-component system response regulator [Gammaproteobacteria bacterium]|nr:two-component system response regulator [Gammaproteobacteria bacterium]
MLQVAQSEKADHDSTILIVDDSVELLDLCSRFLSDHYRVQVAADGETACRIAESASPPDLILLDVMMPGMDGYEVCRRLKADPASRDIPIIFLTAMTAPEHERRGLELGAVDYITKPLSLAIMLARVRNHLQLKRSADALRSRNALLGDEVSRQAYQLQLVQDMAIRVVTSVAETRHLETGNHIRRTALLVKALAQQLSRRPRFTTVLPPEDIELLYKLAPLHDIGKVGIPDSILLKPGRLTPDEFEVMKTHTTLGRDVIMHAEIELGARPRFLDMAAEIALSHHEKWDGSGYPQGLKGEEIPLSARLMAVADVYDVLTSRRVYKAPVPHNQTVATMRAERGRHFDPDILDAFLEIHEDFHEVAQRYLDRDSDLERPVG